MESGYKGVTFNNRLNKFIANIFVGGKQTYIGVFPTAEQAATAYNQKAKEAFGDFAFLNKISTPTGVEKQTT